MKLFACPTHTPSAVPFLSLFSLRLCTLLHDGYIAPTRRRRHTLAQSLIDLNAGKLEEIRLAVRLVGGAKHDRSWPAL
jgi:hypothetical protein